MTTVLSREAALAEKRRYWKQYIDIGDWQTGGQTQVIYCSNHLPAGHPAGSYA